MDEVEGKMIIPGSTMVQVGGEVMVLNSDNKEEVRTFLLEQQ